MQCEMCGTEAARPRRISVEGTILRVCPNCERFGKPLDPMDAKAPAQAGNVGAAMERRKRITGSKDVFETDQMRLELVADYAQRIKMAREKKGWTRQDLGGRVKEPESAILKIEGGSMHPTDVTARRMEKELGIKLFETVSSTVTKAAPTKALTLGDILRQAQRKRDE